MPALDAMASAGYSARGRVLSGEEASKLAARRIKRILLRLRISVIEQRSAIIANGRAHERLDGPPSQFGILRQIPDQLAAQKPEIVPMPVQGLLRQPEAEQMMKERRDANDDLFAGHHVAFVVAPALWPIGQVRHEGGQRILRYATNAD